MKTRYQAAPAHATNIGTNTRTYLTIHETANRGIGANAQAHANLQSNGYKLASWHWTVDDKQAIQSHPHTKICWHAGSSLGNKNSIGIEVCVNADGNETVTRKNAAKLAAKILHDEKIPLKNMVQHHHWTGKNCPTRMRNSGWKEFVALVETELANLTKPKVVGEIWHVKGLKAGQKLAGRSGPSLKHRIKARRTNGNNLRIVKWVRGDGITWGVTQYGTHYSKAYLTKGKNK